MRGIQALGVMLMAAAVPAFAQTRVEMPRPGAVSMIGVRLADVTADEAKTMKLPRAEGAMVESVNPKSPASAAGLHAKDVIVEFDGVRVRSALLLTRLVTETPVGRDVTLSVIRDGKKSDLHLKTEAGSWFNPQFGGIVNPDQMRGLGEEIARAGLTPRGRLGVTVQAMTPELADYFGVKSGVLVASVQKDSAAEKAGLKRGTRKT